MLDKIALRAKLKKAQSEIVYESDEDEGAAEYYGELNYVIDVIDKGGSEYDIRSACELVGVSC